MMKKISSDFTFVLKHLIPWAIFSLLVFAVITAFYNGQFYFALGLIVIGAPVVGITKTMLMELRTVYVDKEQEALFVGSLKQEEIKYEEIITIAGPTTPPYIIRVRLNKEHSFGDTLLFIPDGHPLFWDGIDEKLKSNLQN